jgi:MFS family permease
MYSLVLRQVFGRQYEDRYIIPASWFAAWQVSTNIGLMAGAILSGWLQDRIGRRWNLIISSLICSVAVAVCYVSDRPTTLEARRGVFFLAKTIQGFAVGGIMCTTQTWLSEVVPVALRGPLMALFPIFKLLGQLIGALVCFSVIDSQSRQSYRLCFATQWSFSGLLTVVAIFLPESPAWLLRRDRETAASKALLRLQGGREGRSDQAEAAFRRLQDAFEIERQLSGIAKERYVDCFKQPQLRRTLLVCFAEFLPILFGLQLLGSASYFLQQIGMDPETSVLFLVIGIVLGIVASCITFYTLSKFGRRPLVLVSMTIISFIWAGVGFSGIWQNDGAMW